LSDRSEKLIGLLKDVNRALHDIARSVFHEYGLARPAALVIREIDRHPGITVSALARTTGLAKSNVSKSVDVLVEMGFVEKRSDPLDQRLSPLYATDRAQAHFREMWSEVIKRLSNVITALSEDELDSIIASLQTLKEVIDKNGSV
jgi:DNA-binding MarR family transcriptional regulator